MYKNVTYKKIIYVESCCDKVFFFFMFEKYFDRFNHLMRIRFRSKKKHTLWIFTRLLRGNLYIPMSSNHLYGILLNSVSFETLFALFLLAFRLS